jgi:hypothetical protein
MKQHCIVKAISAVLVIAPARRLRGKKEHRPDVDVVRRRCYLSQSFRQRA